MLNFKSFGKILLKFLLVCALGVQGGDTSTGCLTQPPQQLLIGSKLSTPENKLLY